MRLLFWFSLAAAFYTYIGYPLLLVVLSALLRKTSNMEQPSSQVDYLPTVSLIISAYNEDKVIEEKNQKFIEPHIPQRTFGNRYCIGWID